MMSPAVFPATAVATGSMAEHSGYPAFSSGIARISNAAGTASMARHGFLANCAHSMELNDADVQRLSRGGMRIELLDYDGRLKQTS